MGIAQTKTGNQGHRGHTHGTVRKEQLEQEKLAEIKRVRKPLVRRNIRFKTSSGTLVPVHKRLQKMAKYFSTEQWATPTDEHDFATSQTANYTEDRNNGK